MQGIDGQLTLQCRNFRAYRAIACGRILVMQASGNPALRVKPDALLLTAACVWLVNGLHARPDDGPAARSLMQAILPIADADVPDNETVAYPRRHQAVEEEEEEEDEDNDVPSVPYNPFGVVFLRRLMLDVQVPRMRAGGPFLTEPAFRHYFKATREELKFKYCSTGIVPREVLGRERIVTNKTKRTTTYINPSTDGAPEPTLFDLAAKGYALPLPPVDDGSDVDTEEEDLEGTGDIDKEVSKMWRQFLVDIALKTPNRAGATNASYFKLSRDDRLFVSEDVYKNTRLSDAWNACQFKVGGKEDWERAFGHLFPPHEHKTAQTVQNYTQCKYYLQWKDICATAEPASVDAIRRQLWKKVYSFAWIPHAGQDKLWSTSHLARFTRLPPGSQGPAPRLLVKAQPDWE
jgi:hypothetical protein